MPGVPVIAIVALVLSAVFLAGFWSFRTGKAVVSQSPRAARQFDRTPEAVRANGMKAMFLAVMGFVILAMVRFA